MKILTPKAQQLRKSMTDAEMTLWNALRRKQLGYKFRRQHSIGSYIVDFVCLDKKIIVEVDGGQHWRQKQADDVRTRSLEAEGFTVLRFWNHEVLDDTSSVLAFIWGALHRPPPLSSPALRGRMKEGE